MSAANFVPENSELSDFNCDQTVILDSKYLDFFVKTKKEETKAIFKKRGWFPYINSYYQYGEDYDAVNRIEHLFYEQQSKNFLDSTYEKYIKVSLFKTYIDDQYVQKSAVNKFLQSKPVGFIILGKPEIGEHQLGYLLAEHWNSILIHPELLIEDEIFSGSRAGMCIEYNLRCGRAVSIDVLMRLLEKRLLSKSVQHRGFVICGFPLLANSLLTPDPVSSESAIFNVNEIFEDIFEAALDFCAAEAVKNVSFNSTASSDAIEAEELIEDIIEDVIKEDPVIKKGDAISVDVGSTTNEICFDSNVHGNFENQMQHIFDLIKNEDVVLIYIKSDNEEVINTRKNYRFDGQIMEIVNLNRERPEVSNFSMYADIFSNITMHKSKLLRLQRDFPVEVNEQLERYRYTSQKIIEKQILFHNPEFIIKLDGRTSPHRMFHVLKTRLRVLPISQSILPKLLIESEEEVVIGEGYKPPTKIDYNDLSPEELFANLRVKGIAGKLFKWSLSDWGYFCPVSMVAGKHIRGKPDYAVQFLDKIYFLHDYEAYVQFTRNPRLFLMPPFPHPKCRVFIFGPPFSGKSLISQCIAYMLGGTILNANAMLDDFLTNRLHSILQAIGKRSNTEAIAILKTRRREAYEAQEAIRTKRVEEFLNQLHDALAGYINCFMIVYDFVGAKMTSLPAPSAVEKTTDVLENEAMLKQLDAFFRKFKIPTGEDALDYLQELLNDRNLLYQYLPEDLHEPLQFNFQLISYRHPFVLDYVHRKISEAKATYDNSCDNEVLIDCYKKTIEEIEERMLENPRNGWIIDGIVPNVELLEALYPDIFADYIIILKDTSNGNYMKTRYDNGTPNFEGFHEIFTEHGFDYADTYRLSKAYCLNFMTGDVDTEKFEEEMVKYNSNIESVYSFLNEKGILYNELVFSEKSLNQLVDEVINNMHVAYRAEAHIVTPEEREEEVNDFGETPVEDEEMGGEGVDVEDTNKELFAENRRLGDTGIYCPVTYAKFGVLWQGKAEYTAKYMNKMHLCCNEEALEEFLHSPIKYIFKSAPLTVPPPRICITGIRSIGKTTIARSLARRLGLFYFDLEDAVKLQGAEDESTLEAILSPYWFKHPMKSTGFIIDGFPRNKSDIEFMCKLKLIPDVVLELSCDYDVLINRLLIKLLIEWELQIEKNKREQETKQLRAMTEWETKRTRMKAQLLDERKEERNAFNENEDEESLLSYNSVEEADELKYIENLLDRELPKPVFDDQWETPELASERLQNEIEEANPPERGEFAELREQCESELVPYGIIDASLEEIKVYDQVVRIALPLRYRNSSFFERTYDVSIELAERLLELGYYFLSRFGKSCPVQLFERRNFLQLFLSFEARFQLFPMIHRQYIYFIAGHENRKKFKEDVLKYANQAEDYFPLPQMRVAVVGPPRSAKSTIAERIQFEYGLKKISIGSAVRYVLQHLPNSMLALKVDSLLRIGDELTNELTMRCVEALAFDAKAVADGIVMDGFPNNIHEARELAKWNLMPYLIIDLQTDLDYIFEYMHSIHKPEYSKKFITYRYKDWAESSDYFRELIYNEYQNISKIRIEPSKWKNWTSTNELLLNTVKEIKLYYIFRNQEYPLHVARLLVTPFEFTVRKSHFCGYCPCCLCLKNVLTYGGEPPNRNGIFQVKEKLFWVCADHIAEFRNNLETYLSPDKMLTLPKQLPVRVRVVDDRQKIYVDGMCVICAHYNKPELVGNIGFDDRVVYYRDFFYLFDSEECLAEFMRTPHNFANVKSLFAGSPLTDLSISNLPTLGLLEQFDSTHLVQAVIKANTTRPMVPGLEISTSAMICMGLYLKIHNPKTPEKYLDKYKKSLNDMFEKKKKFREQLAEMKKFINPYIRYQEPYPPFELKLGKSTPSTLSTTTVMRTIIDEIVDNIY